MTIPLLPQTNNNFVMKNQTHGDHWEALFSSEKELLKWLKEVRKGERLIAKFEVVRMKNKDFIIWVKIYSNRDEVFRCKFSLSA